MGFLKFVIIGSPCCGAIIITSITTTSYWKRYSRISERTLDSYRLWSSLSLIDITRALITPRIFSLDNVSSEPIN